MFKVRFWVSNLVPLTLITTLSQREWSWSRASNLGGIFGWWWSVDPLPSLKSKSPPRVDCFLSDLHTRKGKTINGQIMRKNVDGRKKKRGEKDEGMKEGDKRKEWHHYDSKYVFRMISSITLPLTPPAEAALLVANMKKNMYWRRICSLFFLNKKSRWICKHLQDLTWSVEFFQ